MGSDPRINLILALHNHQPVGNLPPVFSRTTEESYLPFLQIVEKHPQIRLVMHYSGILLEWLENNYPEVLATLRRLVARGQVEIMGGGYYEPILPIIPDEDKQAQMRLLSEYVLDRLGYAPRGAWLSERVWEPHLAQSLADSGIAYTVVDDAHFKQVGKKEEQLLGYYLTEEQGRPLALFPISEQLRYLIPFREPEETIDFLRRWADDSGERVLVLADDGEKFGSWPGTFNRVYKEGWLERFFALLEENAHWINLTTFADFLDRVPPLGRIYLPTASYREMGEWSGGYWRNFLVRYPESNMMHKKMLAARLQVAAMPAGKEQDLAWRHIWAAQCNCAYWHGIFGGLYLNFLRSAVYEHLIRAETLAGVSRHQNPGWAEVTTVDQDYDGHNEIRIDSDQLTLLLAPHRGGTLQELSFKPLAVNLLDTLSRRFESYHADIQDQVKSGDAAGSESIHDLKLAKEAGLDRFLVYDNYRRCGLIDHFLAAEVDLEAFRQGDYRELGDFIDGNYYVQIISPYPPVQILLTRTGDIKGQGAITVSKLITVNAPGATMGIRYQLQNPGKNNVYCRFGSEINLSLLAGDAPDRYFFSSGKSLKDPRAAGAEVNDNIDKFGFRDQWRGLELGFSFNPAAQLWRFPIETVSQSEGGLERVYQETAVMPLWQGEIPAGGQVNFFIGMNIFAHAKEAVYAG